MSREEGFVWMAAFVVAMAGGVFLTDVLWPAIKHGIRVRRRRHMTVLEHKRAVLPLPRKTAVRQG